MNEGNWDELSTKIVLYAGKKISEDLLRGIESILKYAGWKHSYKAVLELSKRETCPTNLYGFFENKLSEYERQEKEKSFSKQSWNTINSDCVTSNEWQLFFSIISEMLLWARIGLVSYYKINEHFTEQYLKQPINNPALREKFLGDYLNLLMTERGKRKNYEPSGSAGTIQSDKFDD